MFNNESANDQAADTHQSQPPDRGRLDEGGLRAPPGLSFWGKAWWWFDFLILVKLARLRFVAVLVVIGIVITQWDWLVAYYEKWTRPVETTQGAASDVEWFCPMHPTIVRDNPKEKCPICFMPLSKRKKGAPLAEALPPGVVNRVQLSPYRVVLAGVHTWRVEPTPLAKEITAVGFVEFNERGQRTVAARVAGRIDQLMANETGQMVSAGDPLALLYSPELLVTVQNLLDAKKAGNQGYLESARARLELLGIESDQVDALLKKGGATTHLTIRSPISGHVIKKYVREGQYVEEGMPLYDVADLSTVWLQAQVYEDDLSFLPIDVNDRAGRGPVEDVTVTATTRAFPNEPFVGTLSFIYPHADPNTRTIAVRCEIANPHPHKLRPGMTATLTLRSKPTALAESADDAALAVPESAVIDTGSQTIVYRKASPGVFEGVEVKLGPRMSGPEGANFFPVLSGLAHGDEIVTSGSFLVDAETRLNPAAGSIYFGGGGSGSEKAPAGNTAVRPSTPEDPDAKIEAALAKLPAEDRALAEQQRFCAALDKSRLGSMGPPVKLVIEGQPVFVCCPACKAKALADPKATLNKVRSR